MARFQVTSWAFIVIIVGLVAWLVATGGVAAVTYECNAKYSMSHCARGLQYEWYAIWSQFVLLVALFFFSYSVRFHKVKFALVAFLVLVTGYLTWSARSFMSTESDALGMHDEEGNGSGDGDDGYSMIARNAAAAGYVLLCLVNYILIWVFATTETPDHSPSQFIKETMMTSSAPEV